MLFSIERICPSSVFENTIYRARELTANFSNITTALFDARANDFLNNVNRFFLCFVVDADHHLS